MKFVKLKLTMGGFIWINFECVESFHESGGNTSVWMKNDKEAPIVVKDSCHEISNLIQGS